MTLRDNGILRGASRGFMNLHGSQGVPPADTSLGSVVPSTVFHLDASLLASYTGSGNTWANAAISPADGLPQSAYNFYLGNSASPNTAEPTYNGTAGSTSAYWSFDGADYFSISSFLATPFLQSLHKTTGGTDHWIAFDFTTPDSSWSSSYGFGTGANANEPGISVQFAFNETVIYRQTAGGGSDVSAASASMATAGRYVLVIGRQNSTNTTSFWINGAARSDVSQTFQTTTTDPNEWPTVCARRLSTPIWSEFRLQGYAMGNEYPSDATAEDIKDFLDGLRGV